MDIKFCVSLTTIPSRLKSIYKTIESIQNQTLKPNKIYLSIPYKYKRFQNLEINESLLLVIRNESIAFLLIVFNKKCKQHLFSSFSYQLFSLSFMKYYYFCI